MITKLMSSPIAAPFRVFGSVRPIIQPQHSVVMTDRNSLYIKAESKRKCDSYSYVCFII